MKTLGAYLAAAIAEIAGCFAFWAWIRLGQSILWLIPGVVSLIAFAYALTWVESDYAGRAYAAYGAIYICAALMWMWVAEGRVPDVYDLGGALICCLGAGIILFAPRG